MKNIAIYGAGAAGRLLAADCSLNATANVKLFIDDDENLVGKSIFRVPVKSLDHISSTNNIAEIDEFIIALPSEHDHKIELIFKRLKVFQKPISIVPKHATSSKRPLTSDDLMPYLMEELVGREPSSESIESPRALVLGKTILVTGAGGSIGSEIAHQCARLGAKALILLDHSEYSLYEIEKSITKLGTACAVTPILGSLSDQNILRSAFEQTKIDIVFHAAAYKHVPLLERNQYAAINNNIAGTAALLKCVELFCPPNFILVSSDKAVRPTNLMGATKRICELATRHSQQRMVGKTNFGIVRFGNVLGSSGSVVPLFQQQIEQGGPVTITHRDVTRFFMSIPEAAHLVITAGALAQNGEVFLLEMGDPIKIRNLAEKMIDFYCARSELGNNERIEIVETGLRPGEKLFEELLVSGKVEPTIHPKIFKSEDITDNYGDLDSIIYEILELNRGGEFEQAKKLISTLVEGYTP